MARYFPSGLKSRSVTGPVCPLSEVRSHEWVKLLLEEDSLTGGAGAGGFAEDFVFPSFCLLLLFPGIELNLKLNSLEECVRYNTFGLLLGWFIVILVGE